MSDVIQMSNGNMVKVKGGVKLNYTSMAAYTKEGFLVPFGHPEGVVFAGFTANYGPGDTIDNTNGQDGDITTYAGLFNGPIINFFASDISAEFDVKIENLRQPVYASTPTTFHTAPGAGRLAIGILESIRKNIDLDSSRDTNEICYQIDMSKIPPIYR